jgi:hypothetical protein
MIFLIILNPSCGVRRDDWHGTLLRPERPCRLRVQCAQRLCLREGAPEGAPLSQISMCGSLHGYLPGSEHVARARQVRESDIATSCEAARGARPPMRFSWEDDRSFAISSPRCALSRHSFRKASRIKVSAIDWRSPEREPAATGWPARLYQ